jgi:hypothetical protein
MPDLQSYGDGPADARCVSCGALAVGPCARCRNPVCGDCCVLTTGGSNTFAICLKCEKRGGSSLTGGWYQVLSWFLLPILVLLAIFIVVVILYSKFVNDVGR